MSGVPILPTGMTNEAFYKEQAEYWRQIARDDLAEVERLRKAVGMTDLERMELACRRAEESLGPLEFDERRTLQVLIRELAKLNNEAAKAVSNGEP